MPDGIYGEIRSAYYQEIHAAMSDYLGAPGGTRVTRAKNTYRRAANRFFFDAFEEGYQSAGGDLPVDTESFNWVKGRVQEEFGFIDDLFGRLRDEIKQGDPANFEAELQKRAEGYAQTLDGIFSQGKLRADQNAMLTLLGEDGVDTCLTCQKYKGKRASARWWIDNGLVPAPGNTNYICGGYNCQHYLADDKGKMFTI